MTSKLLSIENESCEFMLEKISRCSFILKAGQPCPKGCCLYESLPIPTIFAAAQYGLTRVIQYHVEENGLSANCIDDDKATILHWAAINNRIEVARYLLFNCSDVNINAKTEGTRATPLHWAVHQGHVAMTSFLLDNGADIHQRNSDKLSPFDVALLRENVFLMALFVAHGYNVDTVSSENGMTPLMTACSTSYNVELVRTLLSLNASVHQKRYLDARTALHFAVGFDNVGAMKCLLEAGASIDEKDKDGCVPIDLCKGKSPRFFCEAYLQKHKKKNIQRERFPWKIFYRYQMFIAFTIPWISIPLSWTIVCYPGFTWLEAFLAVVVFLLGLVGILALSGCDLIPTNQRQIAPIALGFNISSIFWGGLVFFLELQHYKPFIEITSMTIIVPFLLFNLYKTYSTDPGCLRKPGERAKEDMILLAKNLSSGTQLNFCSTCLIEKPIRSKHCRDMRSCVMRYDHYCPFVANGIGQGNHGYFLRFLVCAITSAVVFLVAAYRFFVMQKVNSISDAFQRFPWISCGTCLAMFQTCWISCLFSFQMCLIARGYTTYEYLRSKGWRISFHSSHSKGIIDNIVDTFNLKESQP